MKCILTTTVLTMSCLPAYSRASAQATVQAKVPFEFTVGQRVLPPGDYSITRVASSVIEIENRRNAPVSMFPLSRGVRLRKPNPLVFSKSGDQYFLREVKGESHTGPNS